MITSNDDLMKITKKNFFLFLLTENGTFFFLNVWSKYKVKDVKTNEQINRYISSSSVDDIKRKKNEENESRSKKMLSELGLTVKMCVF